jgi:hypothetical protein
MGAHASEKFLENQTVRFCQPNEYNDPFELIPDFRVKEDLLQETSSISINLDGGESHLADYEIRESDLPDYKHYLNTNLIEKISNQVGCTCFSYSKTSVPINILMWAHYAESHTGMAIQLKENSPLIQDMSPILYRKRRPIIDGGYLSENAMIFIRDLYVKSDHWKYESEYRISKRFVDCIEPSHGIFVSKIHHSNIERVVLGVNAKDELRKKAISFHEKYGIQVILTQRASSNFCFEPLAIIGPETLSEMSIKECYQYESSNE